MSKKFVFNCDRCVNCGACSAACVLYNGWSVKPRNIYTYNEQCLPDIPLVNTSLACNHCKNAACLEGCPSGAYSRDQHTGAVVLDESKCLGCRYCQWNCPYDAPKLDTHRKLIVKCHLCYNLNEENPACSGACPTGALSYKEVSQESEGNLPEWFPGKKLEPAFEFYGRTDRELKIVPAGIFNKYEQNLQHKSAFSEWSLIIFSFAVVLSVSTLTSSLIRGIFPGAYTIALIILAGIVSLFHLGQPVRAWRALRNPLSSPLSREIYLFILYSVLTLTSVLFTSPELLLAAAITGFIFLIAIDSVYVKPDRKMLLQSGQTFISALLLVSFFSGNILPFIFIVSLKVILSARYLILKDLNSLRFLKIAVLLLVSAALTLGYADRNTFITILVISSEMIDRILFYADFEPENINLLINKHINDSRYEKKRD